MARSSFPQISYTARHVRCAKDNMNHNNKARTATSNSSYPTDRRTAAPRSAVLSRRELRRIVAEMLG